MKFEVCNRKFDICPGCGQYRGQYHDSEYPYLEEEQSDHGCRDGEQEEGVKDTN